MKRFSLKYYKDAEGDLWTQEDFCDALTLYQITVEYYTPDINWNPYALTRFKCKEITKEEFFIELL